MKVIVKDKAIIQNSFDALWFTETMIKMCGTIQTARRITSTEFEIDGFIFHKDSLIIMEG